MAVAGLGRYALWRKMREHGFRQGYPVVNLALHGSTKDVSLNLADLIYRIVKDEAERARG